MGTTQTSLIPADAYDLLEYLIEKGVANANDRERLAEQDDEMRRGWSCAVFRRRRIHMLSAVACVYNDDKISVYRCGLGEAPEAVRYFDKGPANYAAIATAIAEYLARS